MLRAVLLRSRLFDSGSRSCRSRCIASRWTRIFVGYWRRGGCGGWCGGWSSLCVDFGFVPGFAASWVEGRVVIDIGSVVMVMKQTGLCWKFAG